MSSISSTAQTPLDLLAAARVHGARTVDGLDILIAQGALSLEIWTGRPAPLRGHAGSGPRHVERRRLLLRRSSP